MTDITKKGEEMSEQQSVGIMLGGDDYAKLIHILENPPEPNERLKEAARRYLARESGAQTDDLSDIERVARGICKADMVLPDEISCGGKPRWSQYVRQAKAALAGMPMRKSGKQPIETAPKGIPVIVAGGIAMQKTGGEWFTGMEEPRYERALEWQPKWWMPIPTTNEIEGEQS